MSALIAIDNLQVSSHEALVKPVSLALHQGRALTILGETGSGKSLLAQAIMGNLPPGLTSQGRVIIDGQDVMALPANQRRQLWGRRLALLPQEPWHALDPTMRAEPQIGETYRHVAGLSHDDARAHARADLAQLGLAGAGRKLPSELSGGMAQRVAFAAARAGGAAVVIADEPTKGLDAARRDEVVALLKRAVDDGGTLLTITHDVGVARQLGGEVMIMRAGELLESGPAEQILANPSSDYGRRLIAADPNNWPVPIKRAERYGTAVLSARKLSKSRGGKSLFSDLSLRVVPGEIIGVTGASGSGKSTLGDMLLSLVTADSGEVWREPTLARHRFQKLYQDPPAAFAPRWTLSRLLDDLVRLHRLDANQIAPLMDRLGLAPSLLERRPGNVSGGELQRFAIMRALLLDPVLLFADEPTSRLDPITQQETIALLVELARERNCAVLLVSHDSALIGHVCDRRIAL